MTEPSLSSDVKSMQADEVWKELDFLREQGAKTDLMLIGLKARSEKQEARITAWSNEHTDLRTRVATLEQVTAGPPEGPGFGQLEQRVATVERERRHNAISLAMAEVFLVDLEQRVAALEGLCAGCKEANELIESMPLPGEELD